MARKADIPVVIEALGTVTPAANVTVRPQVSGVITQVLFKEGQMVKKGELLATIDPQSFQMALTQAIGARQRDEAQLEAARVTLQRYRTLLGQDSIARQDVDTQAALVKQLEGTVTIDRANEGTARLSVGYARIVAPVSGRVGLRPIDAGNYIAAGDANGVAVITQVAPIDVEFAIPQDRVPEIQARLVEGAQLPVGAWDRARTKRLDAGTFSTLDNQVDTTTGTVKAKARFANADGTLFPNQFVNVRLLLRTIERRGRRAGDGAAPRAERRLRLRRERGQDRRAAQCDARRGERRLGGDRDRPRDRRAGRHRRRRPAEGRRQGADRVDRPAGAGPAGAASGGRGRRGVGASRAGGAGGAASGAGRAGRKLRRPLRPSMPPGRLSASRKGPAMRTLTSRDEPIPPLHPAAGRDLAADAGDRAGRHGRLQVPAAVGAAAGRLPDDPGADALPRRAAPR